MERTKLAYKIINFFRPKGLTDEQESKILSSVVSCDEEKLKGWVTLSEMVGNHEKRIASVINTLQNRKIERIASWKSKVVPNLGIHLQRDTLTSSVDDYLDKALLEIFDDHYPDE